MRSGLAFPRTLCGGHTQEWRDGLVTVVSLARRQHPDLCSRIRAPVVFAVELHWLPTGAPLDPRHLLDVPTVTNFMLVDTIIAGRPDLFIDAAAHLIMPAIALGSIPLAIITRITRASVLNVSNEDYVRTARAKELSERRVDSRHIMRNAWLPVVTVIGLQVGSLLAGAVITETVFSWNGVGRWVVDSIKSHDYLVVQSVILLFALSSSRESCSRHPLRFHQPPDPVHLMTDLWRLPASSQAEPWLLARRAWPASS